MQTKCLSNCYVNQHFAYFTVSHNINMPLLLVFLEKQDAQPIAYCPYFTIIHPTTQTIPPDQGV